MANETVLFKRGDSATITSTPITDGQILFDTSGNGKMYLDNGTTRLAMGGSVTIDSTLSKTSTNAVQNKAVTGNILNSLAEVSAATQQNTIAGALALKEVNSSLQDQPTFEYDESGKITGYKTKNGGADTVFPFKSGSNFELLHSGSHYSSKNISIPTQKEVVLIIWACSDLDQLQITISGATAEKVSPNMYMGGSGRYLIGWIYKIGSDNTSDTISINYISCGWGSYLIYAAK